MELTLFIESDSGLPTYRQVYEQLRKAILTGYLPPGARVPSVRELARSLRISRTTVTQSYELLHSEGYLQSAIGSGTFVSQQLPEDLLRATSIQSEIKSPCVNQLPIRLSQYGVNLTNTKVDETSIAEPFLSFQCRPSRLDPVTLQQWKKLWIRHFHLENWIDLKNASDTLGLRSLREAIARYIARSRGVRCEADQIIIVSTTLQAIELVTRVLIEPGDKVILENPGCLDIHQLFLTQGAQLCPIPVDDSGILVEQLPPASSAKAKLVYVTPSHQFPLGVVMSLRRRLELLDWASHSGAMIIEDDYNSDYRYCGRPIPALQGLNQNDSVIYVGDFSGAVFPAVNIGYLVAPPALVPTLSCAKRLSYSRVPLLEQYVLTDFINEGYLERHIRRTWRQYDQRRYLLVKNLQLHLGDRVTILGEDAGIHLTVRLHSRFSDEEIMARAAQKNLKWISTYPYYLQEPCFGEFVLSYADLSQQEIQDVVQSLVQLLNDE
jgi:GntR family transcriptional regulator/MocR family aminotransferase